MPRVWLAERLCSRVARRQSATEYERHAGMIRKATVGSLLLAAALTSGAAWAQSLDGALDRGVQRTAQAQNQQQQ